VSLRWPDPLSINGAQDPLATARGQSASHQPFAAQPERAGRLAGFTSSIERRKIGQWAPTGRGRATGNRKNLLRIAAAGAAPAAGSAGAAGVPQAPGPPAPGTISFAALAGEAPARCFSISRMERPPPRSRAPAGRLPAAGALGLHQAVSPRRFGLLAGKAQGGRPKGCKVSGSTGVGGFQAAHQFPALICSARPGDWPPGIAA